MTADAIPREPSKLEVAFDDTCRMLLAAGMTRRELRAKVEEGLARRDEILQHQRALAAAQRGRRPAT